MAESSHAGHRKRLRKELIEQDFPESVPDHKILEALLFYGVPVKDTNLLAHRLIDTFGSLSAVFDADANDLFQVNGMTEKAVTLIKMILPLSRRYNLEKQSDGLKFSNLEAVGDFLKEKHSGYGQEIFVVTTFGADGAMIASDIINKGDAGNVTVSVKSVIQTVLKRNAPNVVISHNHLTKNALPSKKDIDTTKILGFTLAQMNIKLIDHMIFSKDDYISMKQSDEYKALFYYN